MNVEVLGADVCYGASPYTIFQKSRIQAAKVSVKTAGGGFRILPVVKAANRFGDDELLGIDWGKIGKGFSKLGKGTVALIKSPGGKAVGAAALTSIAGRMTPTQKAQLASAQEIVGMSPQVITGGGTSNVAVPLPEGMLTKSLPIIIGGIGLFVIVTMIAMKK